MAWTASKWTEYQEACARSLNLAWKRRGDAIDQAKKDYPLVSEGSIYTLKAAIRRIHCNYDRDIHYWSHRLQHAMASFIDTNGFIHCEPVTKAHVDLAYQLCQALEEVDKQKEASKCPTPSPTSRRPRTTPPS